MVICHTAKRQYDDRGTRAGAPDLRATRGAILVQVAIGFVFLTGMSAFVVDLGILWVARRQIQNAADSAALAAAVSLGFDAPGDLTRARENAQVAVSQNPVWGEAASMAATDVTFPPCPTGSVGAGTCVRVDAFRDRAHGSELTTIFASLVGVPYQGVRATATAQVLVGNSTDCVRPIAIPDRWVEQHDDVGPAGWDPSDTFQRFHPTGVLLPLPDGYDAPVANGTNGTGYSRDAVPGNAGDYGRQIRLTPQQLLYAPVGNERFIPVRISAGSGGSTGMLQDMTTCSPRVLGAGDVLDVEFDDPVMPTVTGASALIDQDSGASWDAGMNGGRGGVSGGCMATASCTVSPRIVPIVAFDPAQWDAAVQSGAVDRVSVVRIVGLFIERLEPPTVVARIVAYPSAPRSSMLGDPASAFVVSVALVR